FLLSDKLLPVKDRGKFIPTPIVKYYLGITHYLGAKDREIKLELFVTESEKREADAVFERGGLGRDLRRPGASGSPPLILLNPGAQYGAAKCWLPDHFAQLADRFIDELGATVLVSSAPRERAIVDAINRQMKHAAVDLARAGSTL